jgi:hypothetical protein
LCIEFLLKNSIVYDTLQQSDRKRKGTIESANEKNRVKFHFEKLTANSRKLYEKMNQKLT